MAKHKYTTLICVLVVAGMLGVTVLCVMAESLGIEVVSRDMPYVEKLFSTDRVHTLDIVADTSDWDDMIENAASKEYILCHVVIDGESVRNVGLRTKGNNTLTTVASSDSDRYSFKIEFDHYNEAQTYYGLDKLALNNIAQDNTYLKDYLCYQMMVGFGADAPLCSFIYITVNGEDWGLYLAVEGIEEAFAERSYGSDYGQLYKPDSMQLGGGGNLGGQDGSTRDGTEEADGDLPFAPSGGFGGDGPDSGGDTEGAGDSGSETADAAGAAQALAANTDRSGGMGGGNSDDVALLYADDEYDSYSNIFDNAKFDPTDEDKDRLIASIRKLNAGEDLESVVNSEEVLRYFVVHNFVVNFDSYTGSLMHNYYLYEDEGQFSMIAWDYNLAFGGFGMSGDNDATTLVNYPIDSPLSSGITLEERPILAWIFSEDSYLEQYHALFSEFLTQYFDSGELEAMIDQAVALISPYVEKDPTAFCDYDTFLRASETLKEFCTLRAQSIRGQLDGTIPADSAGQAEDDSALVDASHISVSSMGSNATGMGGIRGTQRAETQENGMGGNGSSDTRESGGLQQESRSGSGVASGFGQTDTTESQNSAAAGEPAALTAGSGTGESSLIPLDDEESAASGGFASGQLPDFGGDFTPGDGMAPGDPPDGASGELPEELPEESTSESSTGDAGQADGELEGLPDAGESDGAGNSDGGAREAGSFDQVSGGNASSDTDWIVLAYLGGSIAVLAAGLLFVQRFRV